MNPDSAKILIRLLLPIVIITMACSLFIPDEPNSSSSRDSEPRETKTEKPTKTPLSSPTMDLSLLSSPPPMDEEPVAEEPATEEPIIPTSTLTRTPVMPTPTQTPLPSATPLPTVAPVFSWIPEVVQESQASGYFANLKIDSQDNFQVGYFQDNFDMVWWMHTRSNKWSAPEQVSGGLGRGFHISLALDSKDNPHFAYHSYPLDNQEPFLFYRYWNGSAWMGAFKDSEYKVVNTDISMALGPDDAPHFVFMENYAYNLVYARFGGNGFINQVVGRANPECQSLPIVVDENGNPHLVYQSADQGFVYATLQNEIWNWEVIDSSANAGWYSDIALDDSGQLYVVYYDRDEANLKFASRSQNGWDSQIIDSQGDVGRFPSIAVDSAGNIHVSYYDANNTALKYAFGKDDQWAVDTVDNLGDVGKFTSIAVDSKDLPYIAYFDQDNEDLKLAKSIPLRP
jgi:hypothetical protein